MTPETAIATLAQTIGTEKWPGLLDLMRVLLAKDGKVIVDEMLTVRDFAALTKVSMTVAYREFANQPTVKVGKCRRMTQATFRKQYLEREA